MKPITVSVDIAAPPETVWAKLADLSSHSEWMSDAVSIAFATKQRRGIGVRMEVPTRVGPICVTDIMEVDAWTEGKLIGVRHVGRISGWGRFDLSANASGTRLTRVEQLRFLWYMGGVLAEWFYQPALRWIFRANLTSFQRWIEAGSKEVV